MQINPYIENKVENFPDVYCFCHLRWDFVFQRPQHLMTRFANYVNVYYIEEPVFGEFEKPYLDISLKQKNLWKAVPCIPHGYSDAEVVQIQSDLLKPFITQNNSNYIFWYYTPLALEISEGYNPAAIVYDCMDELSAFKFASSKIPIAEKELFKRADIVFTGGVSLFEAKKNLHAAIYPFPSSIDVEFFSQSRKILTQPKDQENIGYPRIGFFGVIDERMDIQLIKEIAQLKPQWQIIMIGPVVKIDYQMLPQFPNIHYLGGKNYTELPAYLSGWDVALIPFALNESTQFISPTKTPEYLAAGKPVVSTPIKDVVNPYGNSGLVKIASSAPEFIDSIEEILNNKHGYETWLEKVDTFLSKNSWNKTWSNMAHLITQKIEEKKTKTIYGAKKIIRNKQNLNHIKEKNYV